jgi:hypothetical protein
MNATIRAAVGLLRLPLRLAAAEERSVLRNASAAVSARLYIQVPRTRARLDASARGEDDFGLYGSSRMMAGVPA